MVGMRWLWCAVLAACSGAASRSDAGSGPDGEVRGDVAVVDASVLSDVPTDAGPGATIRSILEMESGDRHVELFEMEGYRCLQPDEYDDAEATWGNQEFAVVYPVGHDGGAFPSIYFMKGGPPGWVELGRDPSRNGGVSWGSEEGVGFFHGFTGQATAAWTRGWIMDALEGSIPFLDRLRAQYPEFGIIIPNGCSNDGYLGDGSEGVDGRRYGWSAARDTLRYALREWGNTEVYAVGWSSGGLGALVLAERLPAALPEIDLRGAVAVSIAAEVPELRQLFIDARNTSNLRRVDTDNGSAWVTCTDDWQPHRRHVWERLGIENFSVSERIRAGAYDVPIAHVWSRRDPQFCMDEAYSLEHLHGPFAAALDEVNPGGRSINIEACVGEPLEGCADDEIPRPDCAAPAPVACSLHGILSDASPDTLEVHARLADWIGEL